MKIGLLQMNPTVGDFDGNSRRIISEVLKAKQQSVDLLILPELALCGYPPRDMLSYPKFVEDNLETLKVVSREVQGITLLCGYVEKNPAPYGKALFNACAVVQNGKVLHRYYKRLLPYYDVFDEPRYFEPGTEGLCFEIDGIRFGVSICEDAWNESDELSRRYSLSPIEYFKEHPIDCLINLSASPFSLGKPQRRIKIFGDIASRLNSKVIFANQVGGNDDLIFDGCSFVLDSRGKTLAAGSAFREERLDYEWDAEKNRVESWPSSEPEWLFEALIKGFSDYFSKVGFQSACLGLSGGIDSSVCAVLAREALGNKNVHGILLPTRFTSNMSLRDAELLAKRLQIPQKTIAVESMLKPFEDALENVFERPLNSIAHQNLQPRIRMTLLMAIANETRSLLINTSNKSEIAAGYSTIYGDAAGALSPLGDLSKGQVYELARFMNTREEIIPRSAIERPPSAELKENQTDQDSLPAYEILDDLVAQHVEQKQGLSELSGREKAISQFAGYFLANEYKRFQMPPILRVSEQAFGWGRRFPIAAKWQS